MSTAYSKGMDRRLEISSSGQERNKWWVKYEDHLERSTSSGRERRKEEGMDHRDVLPIIKYKTIIKILNYENL